MVEVVKRGSDTKKILIYRREEVKEVDVDEFLKGLKPKGNGIIRIPKNDLWYFDDGEKFLTHFNLQHSNHKVGDTYYLPKIVQHGYFKKNGEEKLPVLDFKYCHIGKCTDVREHVDYKDLTEKDFKHSFENIKNAEDLKKAMVERYSKSLPDMSAEEIISMGVSVTKLEILGRNKKF